MGSVVQLHPEAAAARRGRELTHAIGMMVALGSWAMMFGALFFIYLGLRAQTLAWPPPGLPPLPLLLPALNTVVIVASSFTLVRGLKHLRKSEQRQALRWMGTTFALGFTFVALQGLLWHGLWNQGITTATGTLGTVFYGLTVLHALHVAAGLLVLAYLLALTLRPARAEAAGELAIVNPRDTERRVTTLRLCGMFWHFVDIVWLVMFVGLFLI